MILERTDQNPGAAFLFVLACLVVVVYGLKFAAPILLPSATALFLAVLSLPVMMWLRSRRVPAALAVALTMLLNVGVVGVLIVLASQSVSQLQTEIPGYVQTLQERQDEFFNWVQGRTGFDLGAYLTPTLIDPAAVIDFVRGALGRIAQFLSMTFLVFLIMAFMLGEAMVFPEKLHHVMGEGGAAEERMTTVVSEVQTYLGIKTVVSLMTGLVLGLWAYVMELDFPVLLGLVAFLLNYVPTVGSIIAAVPAILLSLIQVGSITHASMVTLGYVVVNMLFGNILEPSLMGRRLGLSTLVVILSLLFWGWAWGPLGALLSVPLTVVVKIWLEHTRDLQWVAVLIDKAPPAQESPNAVAGGTLDPKPEGV